MKEYKVVSQLDVGFWGDKLDAAKLERGLNKLAEDGWRVVTATSLDVRTLARAGEEIVIILEREKDPFAPQLAPKRFGTRIPRKKASGS